MTTSPNRERNSLTTSQSPTAPALFTAGIIILGVILLSAFCTASGIAAESAPDFGEVAALLKTHCVKCHGPAKSEAGLNLATAAGVRKGAKDGPVLTPHDLAASSLWVRIAADEMPPEEPLSSDDKQLLKRWIEAGAPGLPSTGATGNSGDHWAFRTLTPFPPPKVNESVGSEKPIDRFLLDKLIPKGLSLSPAAAKETWLRRVSLVLTGIPPTVLELDAFLGDHSQQADERVVDRLLASPHFGERWGKYWLDAAGYSDSNGYFNADSDRPLAWRYRDWVVRALNADIPYDMFVRMQLAGDELANHKSGEPASGETADLLIATHYLRNGQDGTGESDGNPDEVRADKYFALESCEQNVVSSLLGLTIQCAKCHDHKFEPITQNDYYRIQAVFYPAFPIENWTKPNDRFVLAPAPGETEKWQHELNDIDKQLKAGRSELAELARTSRPKGKVLFEDAFGAPDLDAARWSNQIPGDDRPAGTVPVQINSMNRPGAFVRDGALVIAEGNTQGDSFLSMTNTIDWTPDEVGAAVQVTFDLISNQFDAQGAPAERIGYLIALHDFDDSSSIAGGNILIDGHPTGPTSVHLDYPGSDSKSAGAIGATGHRVGANLGVRVTALGEGKYRLEHLIDWLPDGKSIELKEADLPNGSFGFEYCCNRSFVVDHVLIEQLPPPASDPAHKQFEEQVQGRRKQLAALDGRRKDLQGRQPGRISWATDASSEPPEVHLLERGNYSTPGAVVTPGGFGFLSEGGRTLTIAPRPEKGTTTGARLAFANWVTRDSPQAQALLARVEMNRTWQHLFGSGLVPTTENLGYSGAEPTHAELLDWLAVRLIQSGFQRKTLIREMVLSRAFRQASTTRPDAHSVDPGNRLLWRYPPLRLDAETVRDAMLAVAGVLNPTVGGPYVPSTRTGTGEVVIAEGDAGAKRRSLYLYQRRTQVVSLLQLFDSPQIVFNSTRRPRSTIPLQSLALLNGEFAVQRAADLTLRVLGELNSESASEASQIAYVWRLCLGREPTTDEVAESQQFLQEQARIHSLSEEGRKLAFRDFCQLILASNEFLYLK